MMRLGLIAGLCVAEVHANRAPVETLSSEHADTIVRKGYRSRGRASPASLLKLTIAVKHTNSDALTDKLYAVSTPGSTEYGHHLSFEQVNQLVAPKPEDVRAVLEWLASVGVTGEIATPHGSFIDAIVTVEQAETLLEAEYHTYLHEESGYEVSRLSPTLLNASSAPAPYTLPEEVARAVDFVAPTTSFPPSHLLKTNKQELTAGASAGAYLVTPALLRGLYNLTKEDVGKGTASPVRQGVASFLRQFYDTQDLNAFWKKYDIQEGTAKDWINVPASQLHKPTGTEASLDVQWLSISGMGVVSEHWSTPGVQPGNVENEPFVSFLSNVGNATNPPSVFSLSYGDDEPGVTKSYALRCAQEFQMAGVRGITMLAAAGDSGAGCAQGKFVPTFPASCPYVTGVGGTTGGTPGKHPTGESAVGLSGGGFSNYFTRPSYQDDAVAKYKKINLPKQSMWNANGAGFPDIAAQALQFDTCQDNFFYPIDGTSCACPAASGMWGLLTQFRLDAGMNSTLGWLNPLLYQMGGNATSYSNSPYNDVTDGGNNYCDAAGGFPAARGWDAVTGWGTLDFGALKQILA